MSKKDIIELLEKNICPCKIRMRQKYKDIDAFYYPELSLKDVVKLIRQYRKDNPETHYLKQ